MVVLGSAAFPAVSRSGVDDGWYLETTEFPQRTAWLHGPALAYTSWGGAVFVVLFLVGWWPARRRGKTAMPALATAPGAALLTYGVVIVVKKVVAQPRPCTVFPEAHLVEPCPPWDDYSFPSNHSAVAAAVAVSLWFVDRRLAGIATVAAVVMAASRVYVGVHYPHDVAAGLVIGTVIGLAAAVFARRFGPALAVGAGLRCSRLLPGARPSTGTREVSRSVPDKAGGSGRRDDLAVPTAPRQSPADARDRTLRSP